MRTKTTVTPDLKILAVLAASKEMEQYKLPKNAELSYRTVLRTLKNLEDKNVWQIRLDRTEPSQKGGKEKKVYVITLPGLLRVLKHAPWEDIDYHRRIINSHPDLLLTFDKWPLFVKNGFEKQVYTYLAHGVQDFYLNSTWYLLSGNPDLKGLSISRLKGYVDNLILLRPFFYERERGHSLDLKFLQLCRKDKDLKDFVDRQLAIQEGKYERFSCDKAEWEKL